MGLNYGIVAGLVVQRPSLDRVGLNRRQASPCLPSGIQVLGIEGLVLGAWY